MHKLFFITLFCGISFSAIAQQEKDSLITVHIDLKQTAQTIENIGASGCWFSEGIGRYWPESKKQRIAELLFSKEIDSKGNLKGIGLSSWRFNIGGGTAEQGTNSGIKDFRKRTDGFLNADGSYDWNKQAGYRYFLQQAKNYGVETLIAFSNTPPVQMTQNGLGYKTEKDYRSNLKTDAYTTYAKFLTDVLAHFDRQHLHFDYISPVNEPQWDWSKKFGTADQEGTPWTNAEIYKVTQALNEQLERSKLKSQILITEAGMLNYLYGGSGHAAKQIQTFFNPQSQYFLGHLSRLPKLIGGHSYFTESGDSTLIQTRKHLADTVKAYGLKFWQTEYSMLGDGFKDGDKGDRSAMDCGLFLAKVIHADLTIGNATAWQFWNAYEPGSSKKNTRYYLIALKGNQDFTDGVFTETKNLWALGHFSRFIRPGMTRITTEVPDHLDSTKGLMVSAYTDQKKVVMVAINYGQSDLKIRPSVLNVNRKPNAVSQYITTAEDTMNMKPVQANVDQGIILPARSISTIILE